MKILVNGDLQGKKPIIHFKDFDCIVELGDVCDDSKIGPLYKKYFKALKDDPDLKMGLDEFFIREIGNKKIKKYERESLEKGHEVLKYLDKFGKPIFMVAGNWDQSYGPSRIKEEDVEKSDYNYRKAFYDWYLGDKINPKLIRGLKNVKNCMHRNHMFSGINFVGYGLSSGPERLKKFRRKMKVSKRQYGILRKSLNKIFEKLFSAHNKRDKSLPTVFISHNVPNNTKLDIGKDKNSYAYKKHLGSYVARRFCEKYQPLICIGGHVHEGMGKDKIGKTLVINPGFGRYAQVLIDIDEEKGKIRNVKFYGKHGKH